MAQHAFGCSCPDAREPCLELQQSEEEPPIENPQPVFEPSEPFNLRLLPVELRLRILRHTHLGPRETAGYDAWHEELFIHNGKLDQDKFDPLNESDDPCPFKSTHQSLTPRCTCRILPTALFLVDRQMYTEASQVFYTHARFNFHGDHSFAPALAVLRQLPLRRLTRLKFTMSTEQVNSLGSTVVGYGSHPTCTFHEPGPLESLAEHRAGWAAVVAFLASYDDEAGHSLLLPQLEVTVNFLRCGTVFTEGGEILTLDNLDFEWFRFLYEAYLDVATELCKLKTLRGVKFELFPFANLEPWLEREVMGCRNGYGELPAPSRRGYGNHIPSWHDKDKRLKGSNYHPN